MVTITIEVLYSQVGSKAKNYKPCSYTSAIASRDEINMSSDRGYFREACLSLKRVSFHNNLFKQN